MFHVISAWWAQIIGTNSVIFRDATLKSYLSNVFYLAHIISWSESKVVSDLVKSCKNDLAQFQNENLI